MVTSREKKILIVDDEASILTMLKEIIDSEGYSVRIAESAEVALKVLVKRKYHGYVFEPQTPCYERYRSMLENSGKGSDQHYLCFYRIQHLLRPFRVPCCRV